MKVICDTGSVLYYQILQEITPKHTVIFRCPIVHGSLTFSKYRTSAGARRYKRALPITRFPPFREVTTKKIWRGRDKTIVIYLFSLLNRGVLWRSKNCREVPNARPDLSL